ncbi:valine--tRNA ligase [[Acholeplasma] multilocale]|uniref:valine--tRNA ligase n=1 Tax=[Acholeplasma] multilocale TaxID=264638 RepID=UPI00055765FA|nr:valine--tRNA ligase [[Acholeplasma] multilocale]
MDKNKELATKYNPTEVEEGKYDNWNQQGLFKADPKSAKPKFSIILPPPNVTGKLHIGHAWDGSLQDAIIRFKKLTGHDVLYVPGMDHSGISTQVKVEAKLKEQGISRYDLGREKFLEECWKWKEEYAQTIRQQWAKMGLALDYSVEKFTLDEDVNQLVKEIFVKFYNDGIIYKGKRIVNWDPEQKTAISNVEVIYKEVEGSMFYFKYQIEGTNDFLEVATTRPETMFADQCIVVNPTDERYVHLIGKNVINPVNGDVLPIIADDYVEVDFGTGVMKCTPAHDLNDFEIGVRHGLEKPVCMNEDGTINEMGGTDYQGLDRFEARKKIIELTTIAQTFIKAETITHQVGFSERTNAVVEPYLSDQWFVKMDSFAQMILDLQNSDEKINFFPERFNDVLNKWMENAHDWTISRQLWWGHQIPAWYNKTTGEMYVGNEAPTDIENWKQDEDVLDTWFSSGLWPFATLMRGEGFDSEYFKQYFPVGVLVTGYDIIFFWVARMIFQTMEYTDSKPFNDVLIHGLVRDEQGRKMSKSLGNGVDPIDVIEEHGVDALRFFLLTNSTPGLDIKYSNEKVRSAWNFINKLWNASRYVLMNIEEDFKMDDTFIEDIKNNVEPSSTIDKWILNELSKVQVEVKTLVDKYEFALAGKLVYDFVWSKYCSWYIEFAKVNLNGDNSAAKRTTKQTLFYVLKNILIMLHPYTPFVTEEIYSKLGLKDSIMNEEWNEQEFDFTTDYINEVINIITVVREFRNKNNIKNSIALEFSLSNLNETHKNIFDSYTSNINEFLNGFVNSTIIETLSSTDTTSLSIEEYFLEVANDSFINKEELIKELTEKRDSLQNEISRSEKMLNNENFISRANPEKIAEEKAKYEAYKEQLTAIVDKLNSL